MLYKPKFCCQCGEQIDAVERKSWKSGRFCELCATEFGIHDLAGRVLSGIFLLFGLFGIGLYLQKPVPPTQIAAHRFVAPDIKTDALQPKNSTQVADGGNVQTAKSTNILASQKNATTSPPSNLKIEKVAAPTETAEKVYFCGAPTKKGTMCSRRVKNGGRCWQHEGQAALLPQEKLLAAAR